MPIYGLSIPSNKSGPYWQIADLPLALSMLNSHSKCSNFSCLFRHLWQSYYVLAGPGRFL